MYNDKEWKEFWVLPRAEFTKVNGEKYWQALSKEPEKDHGQIHVIEHAAYESEKQRADRLQKELEKVHGAGRDWMKRALDLDEENQKLKSKLLEYDKIKDEYSNSMLDLVKDIRSEK